MVHNRYQQFGGEDAVFQAESELLRRHGHEVYLYERSNAEINQYNFLEKQRHILQMDWSKKTYNEIQGILKGFAADICHVYNTFFMVTPAVYYACRDAKVPVVQSLYNYRLMCANALFLREGRHCEECLHHSRWRGVKYGCYKGSKLFTALVVRMLNKHWQKGTWNQLIDGYITATEFSRRKHGEAGIPAEKVTVKPHFYENQNGRRENDQGYALYIGRISAEKGVRVLLRAWTSLPDVPLKIIGEGPLLTEIKESVAQENLKRVQVLGYCSDEDYIRHLKSAACVVVPSICHDNFPRTIVEAFSYGVPVIASRLDGIKEYIAEGRTGLLFETGNAADLAKQLQKFLNDKKRMAFMGQEARREYESHYTPGRNYEYLMKIYEQAKERYAKR